MIIHDPITCQRIQTILALGDRACLFLQSIHLQSIYLSSYTQGIYRILGGGSQGIEVSLRIQSYCANMIST